MVPRGTGHLVPRGTGHLGARRPFVCGPVFGTSRSMGQTASSHIVGRTNIFGFFAIYAAAARIEVRPPDRVRPSASLTQSQTRGGLGSTVGHRLQKKNRFQKTKCAQSSETGFHQVSRLYDLFSGGKRPFEIPHL